MKRVLFACIDQMLHFDTKEEYETFIAQLLRNRRLYIIEEVQDLEDRSVNVRIKRQYNNASFNEFLN